MAIVLFDFVERSVPEVVHYDRMTSCRDTRRGPHVISGILFSESLSKDQKSNPALLRQQLHKSHLLCVEGLRLPMISIRPS